MICKIYCLDILKFLKLLLEEYGEKIAMVIIADPPYNIRKDSWDWREKYLEWCAEWIKLMERLLKSNGSFYLFHNQFRRLRDIDLWIEKNTHLDLKQEIIWNKFFKGCKNYDYLTTHLQIKSLKNYQKMAEYVLFYQFDNSYKLIEKREELGLDQLTISQEIKSKNDNLTGWYSNIEKGKNYATRDTIKPIEKHLGLTYNDIVPYFKSIWNKNFYNNSVWNYDIPKKVEHITPKPINLIKNILAHSSKKDDLIINLFSGSGNVEIACLESGRDVLGCDNNPMYVKTAQNKLKLLKYVYGNGGRK